MDHKLEANEAEAASEQPKGTLSFKQRLAGGVITTYLLTTVVFMMGAGMLAALLEVPLKGLCAYLLSAELGAAGVSLLTQYTVFIGLFIGTLLIMAIVKPWRPYLKAFGTKPSGNRPSMLLLGLFLGFATNGACILVAALMGNLRLEFKQFSIVGALVFLVCIFIQASTEELEDRGFAYQRIKRTYGPMVAVIASAVAFMLAHVLNDGVTLLALLNIFVIGVQYALMVHYFDSIWMPMGAHAAWNFTQNILFGLPNSGMASTYSIFGLVDAGSNGFAFDTAFGVEGTPCALVVNVVLIVLIVLWGRKHAKKELDIWESTPELTVDKVRFY